MKYILKTEELAQLLLCIAVMIHFNVPWWYYLLVFMGPDISMFGYAMGNKPGAFLYNLFHHKGVAIVTGIAGWLMHQELLIYIGIILYAHSSMDRLFGYGLKFSAGFKETHLGRIGK